MPAIALLAAAALLSASPTSAGEEAAVARVRRLYRETEAAIEAARAQAVQLSGAEPGRPWKPLPLEAECEANVAPCAVVWRVGGKVVKVRFLDTSESGDWYTTVEYYFRPDGRVAFRLQEHLTYACAAPGLDEGTAPCRIEQREWRDEAGTVLRRREARSMTLKGEQQPMGGAVSFEGGPSMPHYARLAELPFARQL